MANTSKPRGFVPSKSLIGAPWNALVRKESVSARQDLTTNNGGDIYVGDVVVRSSTDGLRHAIQSDSAADVVGVCVAVGVDASEHDDGSIPAYNADNLERRYLPLDEAGAVYYVPKEYVLFETELASATDGDVAVGGGLDVETTAYTVAHGSRTSGLSNVQAVTDSGTEIATIVEWVEDPENDSTAAASRVLVKLN